MNKRDTFLMLPLLAIVFFIGGYFFSTRSLLPSIFTDSSRIQAYDSDIEQANIKLTSINDANNTITRLSSTVNTLLLAVPDTIDAPNLITEVEAMAVNNNLTMPSITPPANIVDESQGAGLTTNLSVVGSFQDVANFINSIETSIRFSKIQSLSMSATESGLSATIGFDVFMRPAVTLESE